MTWLYKVGDERVHPVRQADNLEEQVDDPTDEARTKKIKQVCRNPGDPIGSYVSAERKAPLRSYTGTLPE